ncbi:LOW QUALITY PROTEIN: polyunsaturated fatty acid lipoxygenase ALOX8-like [Phoenicopterus ruber ruber]
MAVYKVKVGALFPEYMARHWREDDFFGYQFLNGNNPVVLRRCAVLPAKFLLTPEMVAGSLGGGTNPDKETQEGWIFIVEEGIPPGAGGLLRPIAIQLSRTPGPTSPIFFPSDTERDLLLAKTWARDTDFYSHQLLTHLLRTHLFGEVFAIATLRQLPACHPLFKGLLVAHFHFTLHINMLAQCILTDPGGVINRVSPRDWEHWGLLGALGEHWGVLGELGGTRRTGALGDHGDIGVYWEH